ncbi:hypothetical protein C8F01DRAFT_919914, partial [Mycena amicta]
GSDWSNPSTNQGSNTVDTGLFVEKPGFGGDRVLANLIIFRRDYLLYYELTKAVSDGDTGRVLEALKVRTITSRGYSHGISCSPVPAKITYASTYMDLQLFLNHDASPELKAAIMDNWLVNLSG